MMKTLAALAAFALGTHVALAQGAPPPLEVKATGTPGRAEAVRTVKESFTVVAVDKANRSVTLKNARGETQAFKVGPDVARFDEIAPGDTLAVEYQEGLALEVQSAGAQDVAPEAVAVAERADKDQPAAGGVAAGVRATVVVTAIDTANRMVVFQGPRGEFHQVKVGPKIQLEKLKVGDKLLATYVQAVAVALEKPAPK
jgi:hypothetical protein